MLREGSDERLLRKKHNLTSSPHSQAEVGVAMGCTTKVPNQYAHVRLGVQTRDMGRQP